MALENHKLGGFSFLHKNQPDRPNMSTTQFKSALDSQAEELRDKLNSLIDELLVGSQFDKDYIKVQKFGAKGDGITDDTDAIQGALNSNSSIVYFPDGNYKITGKITVTTGAVKKIIGSKNTVFAVILPTSSTLFDFKKNVEVEGITFDFNNSPVTSALSYDESLGTVTLTDLHLINVRDTDSATSTTLINIATKGNTVDINGVEFRNCYKKGNGVIGDGGGSLTGIYLVDRTNPAPVNGTIKNIRIVEMHNIDVNGAIMYEDVAGIYPSSADNSLKGYLSIENVYGYNFGKRLIKTHASNIGIRNVFAYSDTNDTLVAIGHNTGQGLGEKKNITVSDVQVYGTMNIALAPSGNNISYHNIVIDIQKPNLAGVNPNAFGFSVSANQVTITNATITSERGVVFGGINDYVQDFKMSNAVITIPTWGVNAFDIPTGTPYGFKTVTIDNVSVVNSSTISGACAFLGTFALDGTGNKKAKGLNITDCTFYSDVLDHIAFPLYFVDDINITNFVHSNSGSIRAFRTAELNSCKNIRINNMYTNALSQSAVVLKSCDSARVFGLFSPSSSFSASISNSTNIKLKDLDRTKVSLNDAVAIANTFVENDSSYGTTQNRPTAASTGHSHFDTTLNKPLWWSGTAWVDLGRFVAVPATATSAGNAGDWSVDAGFLYTCHATNTWRRVAVVTW